MRSTRRTAATVAATLFGMDAWFDVMLSSGRSVRIGSVLTISKQWDLYAELARLGHVSPARLTQIMVLLHLAPSIQEYLLYLSAGDSPFITELVLRKIAREPRLPEPPKTDHRNFADFLTAREHMNLVDFDGYVGFLGEAVELDARARAAIGDVRRSANSGRQ